MGAVDVTKVRWVTGRLSVDPADADLTGSWPFGGTGLGAAKRVAWFPGQVVERVRAAEFGGEVVEVVRGAQTPRLVADLREWFGDAHGKVWVESSASGKRLTYPGSGRAGDKLSGEAVKLLFTPDDTATDPAILLYKAIPVPAEAAEIPLSVTREMAHPVAFEAIRDSTGRVYDSHLLTSLVYP